MEPVPKLRRVFVAIMLATLAIFGGLIAAITLKLRARLHEQVLRREAEAIHAVALTQLSAAQLRVANGPGDATQDLFAAVLESTRLPRGVLAVQLFDPEGVLRAMLPNAGDPDTRRDRWWPDALAKPQARLIRHGALEDVYGLPREPGDDDATTVPLLDIVVPLQSDAGETRALGVARYWLDGSGIAAELARLDRGLAWQAGLTLGGGALLMWLVLLWAFRRLADAQRRLLAQSADLARANQELDFAAKTGALGAISAHLMHGLKSPLAGLEGFVAETGNAEVSTRGEAWQTAMETTRRLRTLVNEVVSVLRDETAGGADYPVPVAELLEALRARVAAPVGTAEVRLALGSAPDLRLAARTANLTGLVLANLVTNAVEASPRGSEVRVDVAREAEGIVFRVSDSGPGLPESIRSALFRPVTSTKAAGGGMGLAISHRLARHAGGHLALVRSDEQGTVFCLTVPAAA